MNAQFAATLTAIEAFSGPFTIAATPGTNATNPKYRKNTIEKEPKHNKTKEKQITEKPKCKHTYHDSIDKQQVASLKPAARTTAASPC